MGTAWQKCQVFNGSTHYSQWRFRAVSVGGSSWAVLSLGSIVWVPRKFDEKHTFNCESNDGLDLSQHVNSCNRQLRCLMMHRGIAAKCLSHQYWSMCTKTPKLCCWTRPKYAKTPIPSCRRCSWHCTLHSSLFLRSQPKNLSYQECLDQKQNNTYVPVANDLQFVWPRRPRLNPRLRWKVSPSMLLSAPKVTAVHPRMVPWFLGGVAEEWTDSVHFRPRLKDLFLTHGSTTRVPRNIQVGWREWIEEEMIRELNSPRSCRWSMETIFQYFSLLNSLERCSFEWWQQRRQRGKISDGRRESAVRLLPLVLLSLLQPGWGLIEAAESLTSRRTQEQILL